jgi:hypothetical protein
MLRWLRRLTMQVDPGPPAMRAVAVPTGDPYRETPSTPPADRMAVPCTLDQVLAALRDARLPSVPRRHGFDLLGKGTRAMPVRVRDVRRIVPADMSCGTKAPELLIDLALALVPLFGPLLVDIPFAGPLLVDGSRDRVALGEHAAERVQRVGQRVATRAPLAFPLLLDLARRMRQT